MKVWLINPYGTIPGEAWRPYRFAMLGNALTDRGHQVIWWTANFSHHFKRFRSPTWHDLHHRDGFLIRLVPASAYTGNVSLGRLKYEVCYSHNLIQRARSDQSPDCIVGVDPSQIVGYTCTRLAHIHRAPLVLDVFDLWPELFSLALPRPLRFLSPAVFLPFYLLRRSNLRKASGIVSLCRTYLDAAIRQLPRHTPVTTAVIYNGIPTGLFASCASYKSDSYSTFHKAPGEFWGVYAGSLGSNYDIATMLDAANILNSRSPGFRLFLAGDGPMRSYVSQFISANESTNIFFLGALRHQDLHALYRTCDFGLCPYKEESNVGMPDKAYDYIAAGLPIINSLKGEFEEVVRLRHIGLQYQAGQIDSLVNAISTLRSAERQLGHMTQNALEISNTYDSTRQYNCYAAILESIVDRRRRGIG